MAFTRQDGTSYELEDDNESVQENMMKEDNQVDREQSVEVEGVGIDEEIDTKDNDGAIDGDVEMLPPPLDKNYR